MAHAARLPLLNADVGEHDAAIASGAQSALLDFVQLANVACGGHAGSPASIEATVAQCRARGVHVGAHPSYPDRADFGRKHMVMRLDALCASVREQVELLLRHADGVRIEHVKPHGALYHTASDDPATARALATALDDVLSGVTWVLRADSAGCAALRADGRHVLAEGFVDRRYAPDGTLVPRGVAGAVLDAPADAATQAQALAHAGRFDTLCIHGDHPRALEIAAAVRAALVGRSGA